MPQHVDCKGVRPDRVDDEVKRFVVDLYTSYHCHLPPCTGGSPLRGSGRWLDDQTLRSRVWQEQGYIKCTVSSTPKPVEMSYGG